MKTYLQFTFENIHQENNDILIATLSDIGFEGFQEENGNLIGYADSANFNQSHFDEFVSTYSLFYKMQIMPDVNWNNEWESNFHPIEVWDQSKETILVYLRAEFHHANNNAKYDIIITPKMSFGTGHHATTYLMMEKMLQLNFTNKNVIDFGTGTGVLSILAEKLGANKILAIDNDDWSIQNALSNIEANQSKNISVQKAEECFCDEVKTAILLANINLNVIKDNILKIKESLISGGEVLFSGILDENINEMRILLKENKFSNLETISKDGWLLIYALND